MKKKTSCLTIILGLMAIFFISCGFTVWAFKAVYYGISVSPDGKTLVVTTPQSVTMYQMSSGKMLHREYGKPYGRQDYQGEFSYIAWSPDGSSLAVAKLYNGIWIWDTKTWELLTERDSESSIEKEEPSFAWSPDGQQLALGTGNGEIWVWNKNENLWKLKAGTSEYLISIAWTTNGQLLKLQDHEIYDVETGKLLSELTHDIDGAGKAAWSPDGSHVYIFFDLGGGVMDVEANKYEFGAGFFPEFAWSKSGQYFASVEECSNDIFVWDTITNKIIRQEKQGSAIYALAWKPNNDLIALGVRGGKTLIWNTETGETIKTIFVPVNLDCLL